MILRFWYVHFRVTRYFNRVVTKNNGINLRVGLEKRNAATEVAASWEIAQICRHTTLRQGLSDKIARIIPTSV